MSRRIFTRISGREQVNSAVPGELAEKTSDSVGDRDEALREHALDDLVEKMMDGEKYPRRGNRGITLKDILLDADASELSEAIVDCLYAEKTEKSGIYSLRFDLRKIVGKCLCDSHWHDQHESELAEEENEAQKERMEK